MFQRSNVAHQWKMLYITVVELTLECIPSYLVSQNAFGCVEKGLNDNTRIYF